MACVLENHFSFKVMERPTNICFIITARLHTSCRIQRFQRRFNNLWLFLTGENVDHCYDLAFVDSVRKFQKLPLFDFGHLRLEFFTRAEPTYVCPNCHSSYHLRQRIMCTACDFCGDRTGLHSTAKCPLHSGEDFLVRKQVIRSFYTSIQEEEIPMEVVMSQRSQEQMEVDAIPAQGWIFR